MNHLYSPKGFSSFATCQSKAFLYTVLIWLGSFGTAGAQGILCKVTGSPCVGTNMVFTIRNTSCSNYSSTSCLVSTPWYVRGTNYTIVSQSNSSITVRWNSAQPDVYVGANYYGCGSGTIYSERFNIQNIPPTNTQSFAPFNPAPICPDGSINFSASQSSGGDRPYYTWRVNGNVVLNGENKSNYVFSGYAAGTYTVEANVTSSDNCASPATIVTSTQVTVKPWPIASITAAGSTTFCQGISVALNAVTGTNYLYQWRRDGAAISGATGPSYTAGQGGNYDCQVTLNGCSRYSNAIPISVNPAPVDGNLTANGSAGPVTICLGQSVTIATTGGTGTPYYWCSNNGVQSWNVFEQAYGGQYSFQHTPTTIGTYRYHVRNQNDCGFCWNTGGCPNSHHVDVTVLPNPPVTINTVTGTGQDPTTELSASAVLATGLTLDGVDDYVQVGTMPELAFNYNTSFTIEAWFNTTSTGHQALVSKMVDAFPYQGYDIFMYQGYVMVHLISDWGASNAFKETTTVAFNDGKWHHVAWTYNGNGNVDGSTIYIDGLPQATITDVNSLSATAISPTTPFIIGSRHNGLPFKGQIDEVRIWNSVRSQSEIQTFLNKEISPASTNLLAYWPMNEATGTAVSEATGKGWTGSLQRGGSWFTSTTYSWSPASGLSTAAGAKVIATPGSATTYTVTATNANGCTSTASVLVNGNDHNFIVANTILTPNKKTPADLRSLTINDRTQEITYFDELGRTMQQVVTQGSPSKQDIIQPVAYDAFGREAWRYLPYTRGNNGFYRPDATKDVYADSEQYGFYQTASANPDKRAFDASARAEIDFEKSPMGRVLEQGAPGAAWAIVKDAARSGNTIKTSYRTNKQASPASEGAGDDNVRLFAYEFSPDTTLFGWVSASEFYPAGHLFVAEMIDEHKAKALEYKNREGQVVLKRIQDVKNVASFVSTYYVYDDLGQLRLVIQPEGAAALPALGQRLSSTFMDSWCFQYHYDYRGRMIEKKVPGAGAVRMVYNLRDQLVLTQDARQREGYHDGVVAHPAGEWTFTKYDMLGRVVQTGIYSNTGSQAAVQTAANGIPVQHEGRNGDATTYTTHLGYTSNAFPKTSITVLNANYYDDYDYNNNGTADYAFDSQAASGMMETVAAGSKTRGKPTGSATKVQTLSGATVITSILSAATFYDGEGRPIQTRTDNLISGSETGTSVLDFAGKLKQSKLVHSSSLAGPVTVFKKYAYDHAQRLLGITQITNAGTEERILNNLYNELGQLKQKKLGLPASGSAVLQTIDYKYNIRGWLSGINDVALSTRGSDKDLFGLELQYNEATLAAGNRQYNGNIGGQKWISAIDNVSRSYVYEYDAMNRLKRAVYSGGSGEDFKTTGYDYNTGTTEGEGIIYDRNGNIRSMAQFGLRSRTNSTDAAYGLVDNLQYAYSGNRLTKVTDRAQSSTTPYAAGDFFDVNAAGADDYGYLPDGSLQEDKNKGIVSVNYNHLGLPARVLFTGTNKRIDYLYDAAGRKLRKTVYEPGKAGVSTDYASGFVYEQGNLQFFAHEEGRVLSPQSVNQSGFVYEYA